MFGIRGCETNSRLSIALMKGIFETWEFVFSAMLICAPNVARHPTTSGLVFRLILAQCMPNM